MIHCQQHHTDEDGMQKRTLFTVTSSGIASNCREGGHTPDQTRGGGELGNEHPGTKKFQGSAHVPNAPPPLPPSLRLGPWSRPMVHALIFLHSNLDFAVLPMMRFLHLTAFVARDCQNALSKHCEQLEWPCRRGTVVRDFHFKSFV